MDEEMEYECPECGASLPKGARFCTSCDAEFEWEEDKTYAVDELLEEIAKPRVGEGPKVYPEEEVEEKTVEEIPSEEVLEEVPKIKPEGPRLYVGLFSVLGLSFIVLMVIALIMTIVALHWDSWINGSAEENIGDFQMNFVYLGVTGIVVCLVVVIVDVLRNRKRRG